MALRCVYTDLDGTLLGKDGSLFLDYEGNFSRKQALALEACSRAGVEVVIKSGRREAQVMEDARLISQTAYIYEAGCGLIIDGDRTLLTGDLVPDEDGNVADKLAAAGIPELLFEHFAGRLEYHAPWHHDRQLSLLFRGKVDVDEANRLLAERGHGDLRFLDNGAIHRRMPGIEVAHAYHLVPGEASKARAVATHMRARGFDPDTLHRDRRLRRGPGRGTGGRSLLRARQRARTRSLDARGDLQARQRDRHRGQGGRRLL